MSPKPTYEELEKRVAELELQSRRLAELQTELKRSLNFTESLLESIPTPVFYKDAKGRYRGCNAAFTEIMGVTAEQMRGKTVHELWPGDHARLYHRKDLELLENPRRQVYEFEVKDKEGAIRPVVYHKNVFRDENGEIAGIVGGFVDIGGILEARSELETLFSMSLDMICIADINTAAFVKVNPAFTATLGYSEAELLSVPFAEFIHPEDIESTRKILEESLRRGDKIVNFKNRYRCKTGEYRWLNWVSHPVPERGLTYAAAHDITDEIRAQEEIHRRRQFLESVLYHAPDAVVTLDEGHRVVDWNPGAVGMFGYKPEEAVGFQLDDLVAQGRHRVEAGAKTARLLSGVRVEPFETIRYRKDGTPVHVIVAGSPIMVEGVLKGGVAVYTDITERVRGEEALKTSHRRFITVLDSIDATIFVADMATDEILFMNRRMIETYGGDFTGRVCWEALRKKTARCLDCANDRLVGEDGQPSGVVVWQGENTVSGRWYMNHDRAIEWIDGRMVKLQIAIDITDYKKMEDALRRAQKMEAIGTLAGGIAHDFNNLLMGIQGRTSLMSVDLDPVHPHADHIGAIDEYVKSAVNMTEQLLGLVRGGKYEVKPVDLKTLLESSAAMFGRTRKEIGISVTTPPEPMVVEADKRQIEQVLLNIYVNAWQAMPEGGDLYIETHPVELDENACLAYRIDAGRYAKISLTDTGVGMPEEVRQRVFDPFYTTKEKSRGTGLGLASAYGIVKNHGGMITVYSEEGHGTTFNVYLPLCRKSAVPDAPTEDKLVGGTETILLVEDESIIVDVAKAMLEWLGYRVLVAGDGSEAVARASEKGAEIDLVILDLIMPGIDGGTTFDRIREIRPSMPVILSSGYSINGKASEIMKRGCNGFMQKPYNISVLARKIREVLDTAKEKNRNESERASIQ